MTKKTFILLMAVVALIVFVGAKLNSKNNPNPQATENNSSLGIWVGRYPQLATIASTPIKPSLKTAPPDKTKAELMGETFPQTESQSTFYLHTPALPLRKTDSYYLVPVNITGTYTILTDKTFKDNLAESILYSDVAQNDLGYENPGVCNGKMYPIYVWDDKQMSPHESRLNATGCNFYGSKFNSAFFMGKYPELAMNGMFKLAWIKGVK